VSAEGDVYRELQKHLDNMPVGFPATESGVEIKLLKHLFTPEEAEIALYLSAIPEPLERIHRRIRKDRDISIEELERMLDRMVEKGAIMGGKLASKGRAGKFYSKAQLAIGMYEFQIDKLTKEFAQDFKQYLEEAFAEELFSGKTFQMRTIPINKSIRPDLYVATYDDVRQLVQNSKGPFAVFNCICRQTMDKLGQPCKRTDIRETCIGFQEVAQFSIDMGGGREINKEETLNLLERAEEVGLAP
jgi:predicted transcriptional regulator